MLLSLLEGSSYPACPQTRVCAGCHRWTHRPSSWHQYQMSPQTPENDIKTGMFSRLWCVRVCVCVWGVGLTCTTALVPITSSTWPLLLVPSGKVRCTISAYLGNCHIKKVGKLHLTNTFISVFQNRKHTWPAIRLTLQKIRLSISLSKSEPQNQKKSSIVAR